MKTEYPFLIAKGLIPLFSEARGAFYHPCKKNRNVNYDGLCEFPSNELVLTVVYGFGEDPMLQLSNLKMQEKKKLCHIVTKVDLIRLTDYNKEYF